MLPLSIFDDRYHLRRAETSTLSQTLRRLVVVVQALLAVLCYEIPRHKSRALELDHPSLLITIVLPQHGKGLHRILPSFQSPMPTASIMFLSYGNFARLLLRGRIKSSPDFKVFKMRSL